MKSEQEIRKAIERLRNKADKEKSCACACVRATYDTYVSVLRWVIGEEDTVISKELGK